MVETNQEAVFHRAHSPQMMVKRQEPGQLSAVRLGIPKILGQSGVAPTQATE